MNLLRIQRKFSMDKCQKLHDDNAEGDIFVHPTFRSYSDNLINSSNSPCVFHYFHLYFNFTYAFFLVPYRPSRNQDGHFKLSRNFLQKIISKISLALIAFRQFSVIRATWQRKFQFHHPTIFYFYLAHAHLHSVLTSLFFWTIYNKANNLEYLLEKISHCYLLLSAGTDKRNKTWLAVIFFHIVFSIMGIISPIVGHDVIDSWAWSPSWLFRSYVSKARFLFFLCTNVSLISVRPEWSEISGADIFLTLFYILIITLNELLLYLMSLLFGLCMLTLYTASSQFQKSIKLLHLNPSVQMDRKRMQEAVMFLFYDLKNLSDSMNQAWGVFCFIYIIDIIPYLATDLDFGLRAMDWFDALRMSRSVFFFGWNILISAETYRKTQWFMQWLLQRQNRDLFSNNMQELTLLLEELKTEPIGMGASGFYRVNYALAAQVCTIIITFFIITLQYANLHPNVNSSWWT